MPDSIANRTGALAVIATVSLSGALAMQSAQEMKTTSQAVTGPEPGEHEPIHESRTNTYVGSDSCRACHEEIFNEWIGSDHQLAMWAAHPDTIEADFNDAAFDARNGITTRFSHEDGQLLITTDGPDGEITTYPVKYGFGIRPLQQFLISIGSGRLQSHTVAWDREQRRWFDLYPDESIDHTDELHWTRRNFTWNHMCAECHSTNVRKNYDFETNSYDTTFSEISVSCESCHGPGSRHNELARAADPPDWNGDARMGLTTRFIKEQPNIQQMEACAGCHSRRTTLHEGFVPGQPYLDYYMPELLEDDLYFPDGQIKDEVYEFGSFLQSRMHRENVRCTDCHHAHSGRIKFEGNALCTQCHTANDYDTPLHHRHQAGTDAALCIECHMPERTYMIVDPRRDHGMKVPRPDLSVKYGVPNACNTCHTAESEDAAWAAQAIVEWHGPQRAEDPHFADAFVKARAGDVQAVPMLIDIVRDPLSYGPIVRATAAALLGPFSLDEHARTTLADALRDDEPLVQIGAMRALNASLDEEAVNRIAPLARHARRAVRLEVGRVLAPVPNDSITERLREPVKRAISEYELALAVNLDVPDAHLNLGVLHTNLGDDDLAAMDYKSAIRLDADYVPARINLAMLHYAHGRFDETERELRESVRRAPDFSEAHFMLALLVQEHGGRLDEAIESLRRAVELAPDRADYHYNLGVAYLRKAQMEQAESHLVRATELAPNDVQSLMTLVQMYVDGKRWDDAIRKIERLIELEPGEPAWVQAREWIELQRAEPAIIDPSDGG